MKNSNMPQLLKTPSILAIIKEGSGDIRAFNEDTIEIQVPVEEWNISL